MDRREFLARMSLAALAVPCLFEVDPEFLLWRPGAKTIVLPAERRLEDRESGIAIRFVRHYDIQTYEPLRRFQCVPVVVTLLPKYRNTR